MSEKTEIAWTDATFNPWIGCTKVAPACEHCYASVSAPVRTRDIEWGAGKPRIRTGAKNWSSPIKWNRDHAKFFAEYGHRRRVFCASLADVFDNEVDPQWRADLFAVIKATPNLDWLLLTKRIGNVWQMTQAAMWGSGSHGGMHHSLPANVWLGATIASRDEMLRDAPKLKEAQARIRFWSYEPALGPLGDIPVELMPDWIICGGESGHSARHMPAEWAQSIADQCRAAGTAFFMKQGSQDWPDFRNIDSFPEALRIRQWPPFTDPGEPHG